MRRTALLLPVVLLAACSSGRARPDDKVWQPNPGPEVNEACLERVIAGKQLEHGTSVAGMSIRTDGLWLYLSRPGRDLTKDEGKALWDLFSREYFSRAALSSGSSAMSSMDKCGGDIGDEACLSLDVWVCQTDLETLANLVIDAARRIGAGDGELGIRVSVMEQGPRCRGPDCQPTPHYSRKRDRYDPTRRRVPIGRGGRGRCENDGACSGGGNACVAWYLAGGIETLLYVAYARPTFCGCIEQTCTWFQQ